MKRLANERGAAALLYVVIIAMLLMLFTPPILMMTSNTFARNQVDDNTLIANNLAVSGMETFLAYLSTYESANGSPDIFASGYPLINQIFTYTLSGGETVTFSLTKTAPDANEMVTVTATATAGIGTVQQTKSVVYEFSVAAPSGVRIVTNPEDRIEVEEGSNIVYLDQSCIDEDKTWNDSGFCIGNVQAKSNITGNVEELRDTMEAAASSYSTQTADRVANIGSELAAYERDPNVKVCTCSNSMTMYQEIQNLIPVDSGPNEPVIIKVNGTTFNQSDSMTFGSETQPVILIFDHLTFNNPPNITVYGDLYVKQNLTLNGGQNFAVIKQNSGYGNLTVGGQYTSNQGVRTYVAGSFVTGNYTLNSNSAATIDGDLLVTGHFETNTSTTTTVSGLAYTNSSTFNSNSSLKASMVVVNTGITVNSNAQIVADYDIHAKRITMNSNSTLDLDGDLFVRDDFLMNSDTIVDGGGIIAVGGTFTSYGNSSISLGGGTTSLIVSGSAGTGGGEGGSGGGFAWNLHRVE